MNIKRKILLILVCLLFYFFIIDSKLTNKITASEIIQNKFPYYFVGEKYKLNTIKFNKYEDEKIMLKISDNNKAIISGGYLIMKSKGRECLNIYTKNNNSSFCFNIYENPYEIIENIRTLKMNFNSTKQLDFNGKENLIMNLSYKSNNPQIIQVNNKGTLTAKLPGKAIITVTGINNKIIKIKVISTPINGLINNNTLKLHNADKFKNLMIVAHPDDETLWGGANLYKDIYFVVCLTNGHNYQRASDFHKLLNFTKNEGIILDYPDLQDYVQDKWIEVKESIIKDLSTIINYNNWDKIVTHGPEGTTGHMHHKKISAYVTMIARKKNILKNLYYFGKVYKKGKIPKNFPRITKTELKYKMQEVSIYKSKAREINKHWFHMIPYENWNPASKEK